MKPLSLEAQILDLQNAIADPSKYQKNRIYDQLLKIRIGDDDEHAIASAKDATVHRNSKKKNR